MPNHSEPSALGFKDFSRLTQWTCWLLYLDLLLGLYSIVSGLIDWLSGENAVNPAGPQRAQQLDSTLQAALLLLGLATITLICMWIYRANCNVRRLGATQLEFSPAAAVGWYFVPIANLWMPFRAMSEIWQASANPFAWRQQPVPPLLLWWWLLWTGTGLLQSFAVFSTAEPAPPNFELLEICKVLDFFATLLFLRVLESIHFMQARASQNLQDNAARTEVGDV